MPTRPSIAETVPGLPPDWRGHLGFLVHKARQTLVDELDAALSGGDYGIRHLAVIGLLHRSGGLRQTDIGDLLGIDRTSTMKAVDELERGGLLLRTRRADDRRAYTVELTEQGRSWRESVLPAVTEREQRFLAPLSPGERALLQEMLLRLVDAAPRRDASPTSADRPST